MTKILEKVPLLFSAAHLIGGGTDTNRRVFVNLIQSGDIVLEVGANVGNYTMLFSRLAGRNGQVHAFEPVSANFNELTSRLKSSGGSNVTLRHMGVGNSNAKRNIMIPANDPQQASFARHSKGSWSTAPKILYEEVCVASIDEYLRSNCIERLNFMKIDVEGAEMTVIEGGLESLRRFKPILHLEINPDWLRDHDATAAVLAEVLGSLDYTFIYKIERSAFRGYARMDKSEVSLLCSGTWAGDFLFSNDRL